MKIDDDDLLMVSRTAEETRDKLVEKLKRCLNYWLKPELFHPLNYSYKLAFYEMFSQHMVRFLIDENRRPIEEIDLDETR